MHELLVKKFLSEVQGQELWPIIYNCAPIVQTSGWTTEKYFSKFYKDKLSFPALVCVKNNEGVMYLPITKSKQLAKEIFDKYFDNVEILKDLDSKRKGYEESLTVLYNKMTTQYFETKGEKEIHDDLSKIGEETWLYNALVFFALGFDEKMLVDILKERSIEICDGFLEKIKKAPFVSFEKGMRGY